TDAGDGLPGAIGIAGARVEVPAREPGAVCAEAEATLAAHDAVPAVDLRVGGACTSRPDERTEVIAEIPVERAFEIEQARTGEQIDVEARRRQGAPRARERPHPRVDVE